MFDDVNSCEGVFRNGKLWWIQGIDNGLGTLGHSIEQRLIINMSSTIKPHNSDDD